MGARQKLNSIYAYGFVILAAFIGVATGSWLVFAIAFGILLLVGLLAGDIRARK